MSIQPFDLTSFEPAERKPDVMPLKGGFKPPHYMKQAVVEEVPPPPPSYNAEDLQKARDEGYREGFLAGTAEGTAQAQSEHAITNDKLLVAFQDVANEIDRMLGEYRHFCHTQREELPSLALAVAKKVAGNALEANPLPAIESLVMECVDRMLGTPVINVVVHSSLSAALEDLLAKHFANSNAAGEINIVGSEQLALSDFHIQWKDGSCVRNTEALWKNLDNMVREIAVAQSHTKEEHTPVEAAITVEAEPVITPPVTNPSGE